MSDIPTMPDYVPAEGTNQKPLIDDTDMDISVQQVGQHPLVSIKSFKELGLHDDLSKALHCMNFKAPSKIQEKALPLLLRNPPTNMIAQSQSGTGKTAAFVVTMLSRIDYSSNTVQCLCIVPTRELARQLYSVTKLMGRFTKVTITVAVPGQIPRGEVIKSHIVVGTPGTILDLIRRKFLPVRDIRVFVLDEADNMLDQQNLGEQSIRVNSCLPKNAQLLLFSATFPDRVLEFCKKFAPNANLITVKHAELTKQNIKQMFMDCKNEEDKYEILRQLYRVLTIGSSIIFVRLRATADEIQKRLEADGHKVAVLHSALDSVKDRDEVIDNFRFGRAKVLITTNVLARGIDVRTTSMVVNYDIPITKDHEPDYETYLHRIGRTGRYTSVGVGVSFVHDRKSWRDLEAIQRHFGVPMRLIPTNDIDVVEKMVKHIMKYNETGPGDSMEDSLHAPRF